jgi:3-methylfumaryl-CoA hydratase
MTPPDAGIDPDHLRRWVGRERNTHEELSPFPARALAAAFDRRDAPGIGDALPPAWHWLYFLDTPGASDTGQDGHPKLGGFMPPVPLPRRMWAAGHFDVVSPLVLGRPASRRTVIRTVQPKSGRSGTLVFVTLDHELSQEGRICIQEEQNLVYREMPVAPAPAPPGDAAPATSDFRRVIHPDPVLLFRYSALTYNSHRIHYDRPYAMDQEFYPAMVVQGPLLATLLLDLLQAALPEARVASYDFRAIRPSFDTTPLQLCGKRKDRTVSLWTADHNDQLGMQATASLA